MNLLLVTAPQMIIVAGPPGGGKSSHRPVNGLGIDWFNSDDRAAQLNAGSYHNIPVHARNAAGQQLQQFIDGHIEARQSFAFENALRTTAGFEQIRRAKAVGYRILLEYLAAGPVEEHIRRVVNRASLGGHSASERKLRDIYANSMKNLVIAFEENLHSRIDRLRVFDNSVRFDSPRLVLSLSHGIPSEMAADLPAWLETALAGSDFNVAALRRLMRR